MTLIFYAIIYFESSVSCPLFSAIFNFEFETR